MDRTIGNAVNPALIRLPTPTEPQEQRGKRHFPAPDALRPDE